MSTSKNLDSLKSNKSLIADKQGRIDVRNLEGQPIGDMQAIALAFQNFTAALELCAEKIGSLVEAKRKDRWK